jgi:hypothetical protein
VVVLVVVSLYFLLSTVHAHYPIEQWLFWSYAQIWLLSLFWMAACLSGGHLVLRYLVRLRLPLAEHLVFAFALGMLVFGTGVFLAGMLALLAPPLFWIWPGVLIAAGAPSLGRRMIRWNRRAAAIGGRALGVDGRAGGWRGWSVLACGFGLLGVAMLYVNILTPANVAYDSRWYHLALAEQYTTAGRIVRFPEGWFPGCLPQLGSLIYTWAFLLPRTRLFHRIELAAHVEFVVFVATLASLSLLVRWLVGRRVRGSWAALFLFPGIFLYDASLSVAADHLLAYWAAPLVLAARRAWRQHDDVRSYGLAGAVMAGAASMKYQALSILLPVALALAVRPLPQIVRALRAGWSVGRASALRRVGRALLPAGVASAVLLGATSFHWLKNWIFYGNPVYPMMWRIFPSRPWAADGDPVEKIASPDWMPKGTLSEKVLQTLKALYTFSFKPNDWWMFHGVVPTFGFLFTLVTPMLLFLRPGRRTWLVVGATYLGLFIWYWTYHQDRYLQILLPWMAAVLATALILAWRQGWVVRGFLAVLVAVQVVWGGDLWFVPHAMINQPPVKVVADLIAGGYHKRFEDRFSPSSELAAIAPEIPRGSVVLLHERHTQLGIGARTVYDTTQAGINYAALGEARAVWEHLGKLGVTHVLWPPHGSQGWLRWSDDVVFLDFVGRGTEASKSLGGQTLAARSLRPPASIGRGPVVGVVSCSAVQTVTLPELDGAMAAPQGTPTTPAEVTLATGGADFLLTEQRCESSIPAAALAPFRQGPTRAGYRQWYRAR